MMRFSWEQRIERARALAAQYAASAELLTFYAEVAGFQRAVYEALDPSSGETSVRHKYLDGLVALVRRTGPATLNPSTPEAEEFFTRALLQPYKEYIAGQLELDRNGTGAVCPSCGANPQVAVLRPEGEGAKRSLVCSMCSSEWEFRRVVCPSCGEEHKDNLPIYTAAEFPHVRVEACDTCRTYIKAVDLTKNGLAVPVVDELATVALDVWADENGYCKLQRNLLGM
jgi:FdhE protein